MKKQRVLDTMISTGIVAIIRAERSDDLVNVAQALREGGIRAMEVTMTTPGAVDVVREIVSGIAGAGGQGVPGVPCEVGEEGGAGEMVIGVGTVLDPETARIALLAGAEFVVSPTLNLDVIRMCRRYSKVVIPGAFTPTEILTAWEAGADAVKVFPATKLGPSFFKDMRGPLPQVLLTPTGGVSLDNVAEFIKAGAAFVGVGSALVDKKLVDERRWGELTARARAFIQAIAGARGE
ncbi:MAG: 2-dehydro-3-deoxyphosphogluconate aldolase [Firmicutes bacterium]|nr:2-dehydro-3-deoxyphosphogluconate aldolase [Bacillota bacterium]